ncbi:MAG: hypothetical protein ICV83_26655 [Cytophagales bacterium]|nr:hypothetical protein [Cytophagales bacterium]
MISRMYKAFGVLVKIGEIFSCQTIAQLAGLVHNAHKGAYEEIPRLGDGELYDLSHAQKRLWTLHRLDPASVMYSVPEAFVLEGEVETDRIEQAFRAVVERHEILRTNFELHAGVPKQRVHPAGSVAFRVENVDLRNVPDPEETLRALLREAAYKPFNLQTDNLLRVKTFRLADRKYVFFINLHHIVTDGWSREILMNEVLHLYKSFRTGQPAALPPLKVQYKDFAAWHNARLARPELEKQRNYWLAQLEQAPEEIDLPIDFARPEVRTAEGGTAWLELEDELVPALEQLNHRYRVSFFVTLQAAVKVMISRLTGAPTVVLGTAWAGRNHKDLENQIGFYVNTLALPTRIEAGDTLEQVLENVKHTVLEAERHQEYPFDRLVEELRPRRKANQSAVFNVGFTWHDRAGMLKEEADFRITPYPLHFNGIKADLWFHAFRENGRLSIGLEYSRDLFRGTTAALLLGKLEEVLRRMSRNPDEPVGALNLRLHQVATPLDKAVGIQFDF